MTIKNKGGFTLMEVLIYTTILSITGTILSGVLLNATKIKSRQTAVIEVNEQLNFVMQNIQRSVMDSSVIDIENGVATSTLVLRFKDETQKPIQYFYILNNKVYKQEAGGTPQPLTNDNVIASNVNFVKISGYSGHDSLQIDLTLSYNTGNPTAAFSRTLSSAIARVSAATFDSDLIPGSSIRDIGTSVAKWQNIYISGKTSLNGVEYTWPTSSGASGQVLSTNGLTPATLNWSTLSSFWANSGTNIYNTNAGNVGIGITNPTAILHQQKLAGDNEHILEVFSTNNGHVGRLVFKRSLQNTVGYTANSNGSYLGSMEFYGVNSGNSAWGRGAEIRVTQSGSAGSTYVPGKIGFLTSDGTNNQDERMSILPSGNIGIGTTNPVAHLQVTAPSGNTAWSMKLENQGTGGTTWNIGSTANDWGASGGKLVFDYTGSSATALMTLTNTGLVGIGTTAPNYKLTVFEGSANANQLNLTDVSNGLGLLIGKNLNTDAIAGYHGPDWAHIINYDSAPLVFGNGNAVKMTLNSSGNLGIGTTNPGQKLDVAGTIRQSGCITAGTLSANTSGDIICTSDERLKNIYGYYQGGIDALSKINPIRFSYKNEDFIHVGFSAQNVKSVIPEASALQNDGYWSLDNTAVIALTVNTIKEQQKQIEQLKARIIDLESKIK